MRCLPTAVALLSALSMCVGAQPFERQQFTLPSPIRDSDPPNPIVYLEYHKPTSPGKHPAVILVHHWRMDNPFAEREFARDLAKAGIAVAMPTLPYHLQRTPPGGSSGLAMISGDVPRTVRAVQQAASEIHTVADWLRSRPEVDADRIGIVGLSLGAMVASLAAGQRDEFTAIVLMLGAANVADVIWSSPSTYMVRRQLNRLGYTYDRLRRELAPVEPLNCLKPEQGRKTLMINGEYDCVMPRRNTIALWEALGQPSLVWVESGHYVIGPPSARMHSLARDFLLYRFGERVAFSAPSLVELPKVKLGLLIERAPAIQLGAEVELLQIGRSPFSIDASLTTAGISAGAAYNLSNFVTLGVHRRLCPSRHDFRPYAMFHILF